jgi:hypothetical protein
MEKLLFPSDEIPSERDLALEVRALKLCFNKYCNYDAFGVIDQAVNLMFAVLVDAAAAKQKGGEGLSKSTKTWLLELVACMLRACGIVRIEKRDGEWVEVADTEAT